MEKEYGEKGHDMEECCCGMGMEHWPKELKKDFMAAKMKKKEKMLEAKLEFVREINKLMNKSPMESKE